MVHFSTNAKGQFLSGSLCLPGRLSMATYVFIFIFVPALSLPLFPSSLGLGGAQLWAPAPAPRTCGSSRECSSSFIRWQLCVSRRWTVADPHSLDPPLCFLK
ncbi:butyrophilin [Sarotherodon galilaeus]